MLFRYVGWDRDGAQVRGEVDAPSRSIALAKLRQQEFLVDRLQPTLRFFQFAHGGRRSRLGLRHLSLVCSQLAMLLEGGVPLLQGLQVMGAQSRPPVKEATQDLARAVEGGLSLSQALTIRRDLFPHLMIHVVAVAEVSGELAASLQMLSRQFDREDQIQRKVKSAMVYPAVVVTMALGLLVFMVGFMVPRYGEMFTQLGAELPGPTQLLMALGGFVQARWWWGPLILAGAILGYRVAVNRSEGFRLLVHRNLLGVPVFGPLALKRDLARYTQALATTLKAGVPVLQAAESSAEVLENDHLARGLATVPVRMQQGDSLTQALRKTGVLPPIMVELLGVGEMIGNTDSTLYRISAFLEADVNETVDRLTSILEPFLIVLLGGIVLITMVRTYVLRGAPGGLRRSTAAVWRPPGAGR